MAQAGELDVIVASGPTAAVGFNWEMFDVVIFASVDFMDTNVLQAYRRASRGTRTTTLRVIFLRYRDTIEKRIYAILTEKSKLGNRIDPSRRVLSFTEE
jgi:SNF2 family DNA or RNA helicase